MLSDELIELADASQHETPGHLRENSSGKSTLVSFFCLKHGSICLTSARQLDGFKSFVSPSLFASLSMLKAKIGREKILKMFPS
jgi:hypothetical protein